MKKNYYVLSDNIEFIKSLPSNSIDAIITDSPYGLGKEPNAKNCVYDWIFKGYHEISGKGFMGKSWDAFVPQPTLWKECYRVLKPGGYLLSFFGTRTYDWGTLAIRLAGFEIRDCIQWIYGSGFPKSKACLKPANEPICVARKPGPLQMLGIDEARIEVTLKDVELNLRKSHTTSVGNKKSPNWGTKNTSESHNISSGRWPSNVIIDEESASVLDDQSGILGYHTGIKTFGERSGTLNTYGKYKKREDNWIGSGGDRGGASRFFYVAKTSPSERKGMKHPTIKPVKLMEQLVKLYCPPGGIVLDPHFGSGPTGEACLNTGRNYIACDNDPDAIADADIRFERLNKI